MPTDGPSLATVGPNTQEEEELVSVRCLFLQRLDLSLEFPETAFIPHLSSLSQGSLEDLLSPLLST